MKYYTFTIAFAVLTGSASAASLSAPGANDQVPAQLSAHVQAKALTAALDHAPVRIAHALDTTQALDAAPRPHVAQSREFWSDVSETELRSGVKFTTTTAGALVRLSPQGGSSAALDPAGVLVRANGRAMRASDGSVADAKALRNARMDVPDGTLAFRLGDSANGDVEIAATHAQGRYLVHVFEPGSAIVLNLTANHDTTLAGTPITFRATLDGAAPRALKLASGLVTAPDGYSADLHFARNADGSYSATFTPDAAHAVGPQLWEAHAFTASDVGKLTVLRDAKTAFAVTAPNARFAGTVDFTRGADGLNVALSVDTANASRYQVSAVLYGTGVDGKRHPLALAQSAAWLEAGRGSIELAFDADSLKAGLRAPFELRDLRLVDQATMGLIERRARALLIENDN